MRDLDEIHDEQRRGARTDMSASTSATGTCGQSRPHSCFADAPEIEIPFSRTLPNHPPSLNRNPAARNGRHAFGIQFVFRRVNPLVQTFRRVGVQHRHGLLADDWPGIHARVHKMHRATRSPSRRDPAPASMLPDQETTAAMMDGCSRCGLQMRAEIHP